MKKKRKNKALKFIFQRNQRDFINLKLRDWPYFLETRKNTAQNSNKYYKTYIFANHCFKNS